MKITEARLIAALQDAGVGVERRATAYKGEQRPMTYGSVDVGDIVKAVNSIRSEQRDETDELDKLYVAAAQDEYHKDGEIEIDEGAAVSYGDDKGAYVAAWIWVDENPVIASAREALEAIEGRREQLADSEGGHCD